MKITDAQANLQQAIKRFVAYHSPKIKAAQANLTIAAQKGTDEFKNLNEVLNEVK